MLNSFVMWICAHPLGFVGGLMALAGAWALTLVPRLNEVHDCGHPRC